MPADPASDAALARPRVPLPVLVARRWRLSLGKKLSRPAVRRLLPRWPAAERAARRFHERLALVEVPVCGAPFRLDVERRSVSRAVYLGGRSHAPVVEVLRAHVRPGMTVLDAGANVGYMAVHAGDVAGPDGTVLACEPEPRNFAVLARNALRCRWRNVVPLQVALGARCGTTPLWLADDDGGDHRTVGVARDRASIEVPLTTADELARSRGTPIHFVKIDVQGAETEVLRGMASTLASPDLRGVVLEWWPDGLRAAGEDPAAPLELLRAAGFSCASGPPPRDPPSLAARVAPGKALDLLYLR
jgi:FkbM family methyltransferase